MVNDLLQLDVAIDGADEVDNNLNCIKGGGYANENAMQNIDR